MNRAQRRLRRLADALAGKQRLLILTHDNPDPDAIASAWLLGKVLRRIQGPKHQLAYGGIIGRTENRALIDVLRIPLSPLASLGVEDFDAVALVDTQPKTGNNSLPGDRTATVVLDHHPCRRPTREVPYYDIREEYGATTTILYEYFQAAEGQLDRRLATAIFHAIRSETQNLGREAGKPDGEVFLACFPFVDNQALSVIEHAPLPRAWFGMLDRAIDGTLIYGDVAVTVLGEIQWPDMVAQFADLIIRLEGVAWCLCLGQYRGDLLLSIRTQKRRANAGKVIRSIVGSQGTAGGHDMIAGGKMAGGALTYARARRTEALVVKRLLRFLGAAGMRPTHLTRSAP